MANKNVYVNPGDTVTIKICHDDIEACAFEWKHQIYPTSILLGVVSERELKVSGPGVIITDWNGKQKL